MLNQFQALDMKKKESKFIRIVQNLLLAVFLCFCYAIRIKVRTQNACIYCVYIQCAKINFIYKYERSTRALTQSHKVKVLKFFTGRNVCRRFFFLLSWFFASTLYGIYRALFRDSCAQTIISFTLKLLQYNCNAVWFYLLVLLLLNFFFVFFSSHFITHKSASISSLEISKQIKWNCMVRIQLLQLCRHYQSSVELKITNNIVISRLMISIFTEHLKKTYQRRAFESECICVYWIPCRTFSFNIHNRIQIGIVNWTLYVQFWYFVIVSWFNFQFSLSPQGSLIGKKKIERIFHNTFVVIQIERKHHSKCIWKQWIINSTFVCVRFYSSSSSVFTWISSKRKLKIEMSIHLSDDCSPTCWRVLRCVDVYLCLYVQIICKNFCIECCWYLLPLPPCRWKRKWATKK